MSDTVDRVDTVESANKVIPSGETMGKLSRCITTALVLCACAALAAWVTVTKVGPDESYTVAWPDTSGVITVQNSKDG
jgi:hypothetical protein